MVLVAFPLRLHVGGQLLNEAVNIRDVLAEFLVLLGGQENIAVRAIFLTSGLCSLFIVNSYSSTLIVSSRNSDLMVGRYSD